MANYFLLLPLFALASAKLYVPHAVTLEANICPNGWNRERKLGLCFKEFDEGPINWDDAESRCEAKGGHLLLPVNQAETDYLETVLGNEKAWMGATDRSVEGKWIRWDGAPITYEHWKEGEPNNQENPYIGFVKEDCLEWRPAKYAKVNQDNKKTWNDIPCKHVLNRYVCQIENTIDDNNFRFVVAGIKNSGAASETVCEIKDESTTPPTVVSVTASELLKGHQHDVDADLSGLVASDALSMKCTNAQHDAAFISKVFYRNGDNIYQASVLNVFDNYDTCNTHNMHMLDIRKKIGVFQGEVCPAGKHCVGKDYEKRNDAAGEPQDCQKCVLALGPDDTSPCLGQYGRDEGAKNALGYHTASDSCGVGENKHSCVRDLVDGKAKCCYEEVKIKFHVQKDHGRNYGK